MKKYVLVEVSKGTEMVDITCNSPHHWTVKHIPVLHGKRALLEECLKVGEFEGRRKIIKEGDYYLSTGNTGSLSLNKASNDRYEDVSIRLVLTNLDEPEADEWERTKEKLSKMIPSDVVGLRTILQQLCDELDRRCPRKGKP